ncbi:HST6 [Sanghuangporus sanghuang]
MRRPTDLTLDCNNNTHAISHGQVYEITQSPSVRNSTTKRSMSVGRESTSSFRSDVKTSRSSFEQEHTVQHLPSQRQATPEYSPPAPTIRLLFSLLSRRDLLVMVLPAILSSLVAGGIAPFMTLVVGSVFDQFSKFPLSGATDEDRDELIKGVGIAASELVALAVGAIALGSVTSALWISTGERNVMRLRNGVYRAVSGRDMEWFDLKMGAEESDVHFEGEGPIGAGGLMAKFNRDTDDVRMASSLASGMLLQYLTTCIACLVLAFMRSWALTLVILSGVPILTVIQIISQRFAGPLVNAERVYTGVAASFIERALGAIATVKAFNAQSAEQAALNPALDTIDKVTVKVNAVWGATSGCSQFVSMAMFVQGFWFGAFLVRRGSASAGDVMAVFWACLIAASNLQLCIPQFITLAKGKFAMVSLVTLISPPPPPAPASIASEVENKPFRNSQASTSSNLTPLPFSPRQQAKFRSHSRTSSNASRPSRASRSPRRSRPIPLRKIRPSRCLGEFSLHEVTFAYPSRPTIPVLKNISMYFPAGEMTFVVGGSGSGKSSVAQLLVRLYSPSGSGGGIVALDDQDIEYLDERWLREHVAVVSQSCILFSGTIHDNVALGACVAPLTNPDSAFNFPSVSNSNSGEVPRRRPEDVTREEVERVCTAALMHEFVRDLPDGYDTKLNSGGNGAGVSLSGGQKQRLAIARAMLRDPTVLVLDECTSALDATSRVLVFEAIKAWRKNKTTIVITHDLSQITSTDFVYVLQDGNVAEQGYRADLEETVIAPDGREEEGALRRMMRAQGEQGGFKPRRESQIAQADPTGAALVDQAEVERMLEEAAEDDEDEEVNSKRVTMLGLPASTQQRHHQSVGLSGWMVDVVRDLTRSRTIRETRERERRPMLQSSLSALNARPTPKLQKHRSLGPAATMMVSKRQSVDTAKKTVPDQGQLQPPSTGRSSLRRHFSLQFTPSVRTASFRRSIFNGKNIMETRREENDEFDEKDDVDDFEYELEKTALERMAEEAARHRQRRAAAKRLAWTEVKLDNVTIDTPSSKNSSSRESTSFIQLVRDVYPTVPNKSVILVGSIICVLSGVQTPLFSFLLSRLLFQVSTGAKDVGAINTFGGIVLAVAASDGILLGLKFFVMESGAMRWITRLRKACYSKLLSQPKAFFDRSENNPAQIVQTILKDGDDARNFIAIVLAQSLAVCAMISVGLIWALARGWQLTLAGFAIGPVFAITMAVQANLVARAERRNKAAREEIAKSYYECISNIRAIRCMNFEGVFQEQFEETVTRAYSTGIRGAFIEGCSFGIANGLIYFAEALLFFVGAVLVAKGTYTYLQMFEVLNLVVFTVTIGAQLMSFTQKIARATNATRDLNKILFLSTDTEETRGSAIPPVEGDIKFTDVEFSYPERADAPVLQGISLKLWKNECVAIVGASGSGKSTIAALLQRLYEPSSGSITIGGHDVHAMDVKHLRAHVAVVSQNPHLFDASVAENIAYGNAGLSPADVVHAAQAAHVHEFIMSLPQGYETSLGENASLISGGQAQRLAIARALARPARILILDECTSALDPASQKAVMETISSAKQGRTTLVVTHKLPVMQLCDRIVVIDNGRVAEEGTFEELVRRNGAFAQLARGGEWVGE